MKNKNHKGLLIQVGKKNKNGRIYPPMVFEKAIKEYLEKIDRQVSLGELGHPEEGRLDINLQSVSHLITKIEAKYPKVPRKKKKAMKKAGTYQKDTYLVNYRILDTEKGRETERIIKDLVPSPRGIGSTDSRGFIQDDYRLLAIDLIHKKDRA